MSTRPVTPEAKEIAEWVNKLTGISYFQWLKVRMAIDRTFSKQRHESERQFRLAPSDEDAQWYL